MRFFRPVIFGIILAAICIGAFRIANNEWVLVLPLVGMVVGFILKAKDIEGGRMVLSGSALSILFIIICFIIVASTIQC